MTIKAVSLPRTRSKAVLRLRNGATLPVASVTLVLAAFWYVAAVLMNWQGVQDALARAGETRPFAEILMSTLSQERPVLPAPHQIILELKKTLIDVPPTSRRSLVHHGWVTLSSTLAGFGIGGALGCLLAIAIVHLKALEKSLMPWIISSQTVPILALAPIVIVALGSIGLRGLLPKAIISAYLCFFPVAIGMVKGLTSPDSIQRDLMRTYSASRAQIFFKLRFPISLPFLFASLKVAIAIALVGAIVGELPTGAQAGLGARLLAGSYYGQTIQIWAALFTAAFLSAALVGLVGLAERIVARRAGGRT